MSDQTSSYKTLGLTEASTFDEIQAARTRLVEACDGDRKQIETIEAAYDAILMDRLRLRQEGKIEVPDRIRFAEEKPEKPAPSPVQETLQAQAARFSDFLDSPSREELTLPSTLFAVLVLASLFLAPSLGLAVGVAATLYFLNRKTNRFWRSLLLTIAGLTVGLLLGVGLGQLFVGQGAQLPWGSPEATIQMIGATVTLIGLWAMSSFLR
ncbi:MAG: CPP1-like family protein [Leptolyngbyaceae cyanobacterium]